MKKAAIIAAVVIVAVAGIYFAFGKREPERTYKTAKV